MSTNPSLKQIQAAFTAITKVPHCSGAVPLAPATSKFFYARNRKAKVIDFTRTTDAQLATLAETCQPATFGLKDKDVLDESYRKAGKLDPTEFALQFSPLTTGVIETVKESLLQGRPEGMEKAIHVELYKLTVYGPGSFFKAHVDTPRSENMFGSLVVVLPTVHQGGSLILRHGGKETVFDTAHEVNSQDTPHAAFVAFFSDVEHEVALVTSGYRVTLTYNLYFAKAQALDPLESVAGEPMNDIKSALTTLLNDPTFLPGGGFLGFGLSHLYPFKPASASSNLDHISRCPKGADAEVMRVCKAVGLKVLLKALYTTDRPGDNNPCCLVDTFITFHDEEIDEELLYHIWAERGLKDPLVVYPHDPNNRGYIDDWIRDEGKPIAWLRPFTQMNDFRLSYIAYGNEASVEFVYGDVCLVAEVGKASDRIA